MKSFELMNYGPRTNPSKWLICLWTNANEEWKIWERSKDIIKPLSYSFSTLVNDVTTLFQIDCMMQVSKFVRVLK